MIGNVGGYLRPEQIAGTLLFSLLALECVLHLYCRIHFEVYLKTYDVDPWDIFHHFSQSVRPRDGPPTISQHNVLRFLL